MKIDNKNFLNVCNSYEIESQDFGLIADLNSENLENKKEQEAYWIV